MTPEDFIAKLAARRQAKERATEQGRLAHGLPLWIAGDKTDHTSTETRREVFAVPDEGDECELLD